MSPGCWRPGIGPQAVGRRLALLQGAPPRSMGASAGIDNLRGRAEGLLSLPAAELGYARPVATASRRVTGQAA